MGVAVLRAGFGLGPGFQLAGRAQMHGLLSDWHGSKQARQGQKSDLRG